MCSSDLLVESEELNELCRLYEIGDPRGRFASKVTIVLEDGRAFDSGLVEGSFRFPYAPWEREKIEDKFRWLVRHVLDDKRIDHLLHMVWHFEDVPRVSELTALVTG